MEVVSFGSYLEATQGLTGCIIEMPVPCGRRVRVCERLREDRESIEGHAEEKFTHKGKFMRNRS